MENMFPIFTIYYDSVLLFFHQHSMKQIKYMCSHKSRNNYSYCQLIGASSSTDRGRRGRDNSSKKVHAVCNNCKKCISQPYGDRILGKSVERHCMAPVQGKTRKR